MTTNADVRIGTETHKLVLDALMARKRMGCNAMQEKEHQWEKADKEFAFEMEETETDSRRRTARDNGRPQYTTIHVPYSYAQMMTAHTYFASVFLSRDPVLQYQARHGEPENNVMAVEALMDYQTQVGGHSAPYYVWLHDAAKYGLGIIGRYWEEERRTVSEIREEPVTIFGSPVEGKVKKVKTSRVIEGYSGNKLFNVRPYDFIPDPRVPMSDLQHGEFAGRLVDIGWNTIMKRKISQQYINIEWVEKYLKTGGKSERQASITSEFMLPMEQDEARAEHTQSSLVSSLPGFEMVVELIPKEWRLGSTEEPEKWVFTVLDDKVLVEARPYAAWHNLFPFEVLETEIEGYALAKRGMLEIGRPLNDVMTWLINSHFYSVRKTLNGDIVFDPSRVVMSDVLNSDGNGSRIRLTPNAYGQDVRTMIHTLQGGADVTGTHLRDSEIVGQMLQRALGVTDNLLGSVNPGGRKTATEVRTASSSSINRLRTTAEYMSASGFAPLAQQLLQTSQQMYRGDKKFRIVGDSVNNAEAFVNVGANDIAGFYDYTPVDGTLPLDRFALVNMWANLFAQIRQFPQIAQEYNISEIFAWVGQLAGLKNIKQFRVNVLPPGMNAAGGAAIGGPNGAGAAGATPRGGTGASGDGSPVIPLPGQVPGVGRSG
jgi:hypothetical protein